MQLNAALCNAVFCKNVRQHRACHGAIKGKLIATRQQRTAKSAPAANLFADTPVAPDAIRVGIKGRKRDADDFTAFLSLLPKKINAHRMRHVLNVRDPDLITADYVALARRHGMATVFTDSDEHLSFADIGADFIYARLMQSRAAIDTDYTASELQSWAQRARRWAGGGKPDDLPRLAAPAKPAAKRNVFIYFIRAAKERNPAAAMVLLQYLDAR